MPDKNAPEGKTFAVKDARVVVPENVVSAYCNNANLAITNWDIRLLFSEIVATGEGSIHPILRANVVMTPAHAKAFSVVLSKVMHDWEKQYGEIVMPKEVALPDKPK